MSVQALTYIFVGITFALYITIAIRSRAGSTSEFYIAGKGVNPIANGMATAAAVSYTHLTLPTKA